MRESQKKFEKKSKCFCVLKWNTLKPKTIASEALSNLAIGFGDSLEVDRCIGLSQMLSYY